jgi:hypothetical protein
LVRVNKSNVFEKAAEWMSNNVYAPAWSPTPSKISANPFIQ